MYQTENVHAQSPAGIPVATAPQPPCDADMQDQQNGRKPPAPPTTSPYCAVLQALSGSGAEGNNGDHCQLNQVNSQQETPEVLRRVPLVASAPDDSASQSDMCDGWVRCHPHSVTHLDPRVSGKSASQQVSSDPPQKAAGAAGAGDFSSAAAEPDGACTADLLRALCPNVQRIPNALLRLVIR
jgi:hypothetical protein